MHNIFYLYLKFRHNIILSILYINKTIKKKSQFIFINQLKRNLKFNILNKFTI